MDTSTILVSLANDHSTVRVIGKGSFKNASSLKQYTESVRESGCRELHIDMRECVHMDSTFMGVLAGIASRQKAANLPPPRISHLSPRNRELLETLGLDHILVLDPDDAPATSGFSPLDTCAEPSKLDTARTMLEAHEHLIQAEPANAAKFQDVIQFLRDKLGHSA